jgi:hypothetical protein
MAVMAVETNSESETNLIQKVTVTLSSAAQLRGLQIDQTAPRSLGDLIRPLMTLSDKPIDLFA